MSGCTYCEMIETGHWARQIATRLHVGQRTKWPTRERLSDQYWAAQAVNGRLGRSANWLNSSIEAALSHQFGSRAGGRALLKTKEPQLNYRSHYTNIIYDRNNCTMPPHKANLSSNHNRELWTYCKYFMAQTLIMKMKYLHFTCCHHTNSYH